MSETYFAKLMHDWKKTNVKADVLMDELQYQELFELVSSLLENGEKECIHMELSSIREMINTKLPQIVYGNAPSNFPELYSNFQSTFNKFKDYILFDKLINKNIVALGGAFSSGKSSFINTLLKSRILPVDILPSTSVPAYIIHGHEEHASAVNVFDKRIPLAISDVQRISHAFSEVHQVTFGHLLETVFIATPKFEFKRLSLLDTPGYSKPNIDAYSLKTDETIARKQLNSANYILWFVSAEAGTITTDDIKFLQSLNRGIPMVVIVNKSDKKNDQDLVDIVREIKSVLQDKGLLFIDVIPYSCRQPAKYADAVNNVLSNWDRSAHSNIFAREFKVLFVRVREYYEEMLRSEGKRLSWINTGLTFSEVPEVVESWTHLANEIKIRLPNLSEKTRQVKDLQLLFFREIKSLGDRYGIDMPAPSEIDLVADNSASLLNEIRKTNNSHNESAVYFHILQKYGQRSPNVIFIEEKNGALDFDHPLRSQSDYVQDLYITLLCGIVFLDRDITLIEKEYVHWIISISGAKYDLHTYIRKSLTIENGFFNEVRRAFAGNIIRYNLLLDCLVLLGMEPKGKELERELLSEYCLLLEVSHEDVEAICQLSDAILDGHGPQDFERMADLQLSSYAYMVRQFCDIADYKVFLAFCYLKFENYDKAIEMFDKIILNGANTANAWLGKGHALREKKHYAEAIASYSMTIQIDPASAGAHFRLGEVAYITGQYEKAKECFTNTLHHSPDHHEAISYMGLTHYRMNNFEMAIAFFEKAIAISPANDTLYANLGNAYFKKKNVEKAIEWNTRALDINPDNAIASNNLGNIFYEANDYHRAVELYKKAVSSNPRYLTAYRNLANACYQKKDNVEFVRYSKIVKELEATQHTQGE